MSEPDPIRHCLNWDEVQETSAEGGVRRSEIAGRGAGLKRVVIPAGTRAASHSHAHEQFVQVLAGTGTLETDQGRVAFGPGSVFHFPAGVAHAAEFETQTVLVEVNLAA